MIPQLRELERHFRHDLVIIGIHSGKFLAERDTKNICHAVQRLGIDHPVVNDRQFRVWRSYAVSAWPTLALLDQEGRHIGQRAGEVKADSLAPIIESVVSRGRETGLTASVSLPLQPERLMRAEETLAYPSKLLATEDGRLFISDTNHNRILALQLSSDGTQGNAMSVIGRGAIGFIDGDFETATFNHPHGLALAGDKLYVADMENHAIRVANLTTRQVTTVAGTGRQAHEWKMRGGKGIETELNSPWDLTYYDGMLYIAMAGSHQIWKIDLSTGEIQPHAGSGREEIIDGALNGAALAQPSGLTTDGKRLYFADTEASGVRWADFHAGGQVGTIVGTGLFDFGDVDGNGNSVKLQHNQGITWHDGLLYVADTYNHKIKEINPRNRTSATFLGIGEPGHDDGNPAAFYEPDGISIARGLLYIADTNNHHIRVADLTTKHVSTLTIAGL